MNKTLKLLRNTAVAAGIICAVRGLDTRLEVTHYTLHFPKLPKEFEDFRIVQLSDYHCDTIPGLLEAVRSETPNIILTTGDMADDKGSCSPAVRLFSHLMRIAPTFAVTGNHDLWRSDYAKYEFELNRLGIRTLHNETIPYNRNGESIYISGIDDPFTRDGASMRINVKKSLDLLKLDTNNFNLLLFHRANMFDCVKKSGFDLILTGHMHGGQFRLPSGQGVLAPKSGWGSNAPALFPKYFAGLYEYENTRMIVNRGLGNPMIIPRLFNRPEITVIKLKKGDK